MRKPRGLNTDWVSDFGPGPPPREAPQEPWEGAQAARERPPGTHARGILVYIIHYTVYSIHYTVYRVLKYTVYWYTGHLYTVYWYTGCTVYCVQCTMYGVKYTV